ncbi:DUF1015 family protein [Nitrolancea hollandica]|uniref:DUF1015 domain-containing protein n=1 Tax=Nitrolancea hollandica Lb TaxID=1129897 RepID=I4EKA6_9BACT|nr:DUF1015 domain-containing protein [Nitrolancea hollandica]CCF85118.1 conserved hypothetical protein [Nitrolancea hollandica Lb]
MAVIRPFQGIRFDVDRVGGLQQVIGPAAEIPPVEQPEDANANRPYAAIRLQTPEPTSPPTFSRAAILIRRWLAEGILIHESKPAFYLYEHEFSYQGERHRSRGFFAALRLPNGDMAEIIPHERIFNQQIDGHVALLQQVQANLNALFTLVEDNGDLNAILDRIAAEREPDESGTDDAGDRHRLWVIDQPATIDALIRTIQNRPLFIADGHHRFTAALAYRDRLLAEGIEPGPARNILTYIASAVDSGAMILPIHRLVRSFGTRTWPEVRDRLARDFEIEEQRLHGGDIVPQLRNVVDRLPSEEKPAYVLLEPGGERLLLLRLRDWSQVRHRFPAAPGTQPPDVTLLNKLILKDAFGFDRSEIEARVVFTPDLIASAEAVQRGQAVAAIFVSPPALPDLLSITRSGSRLPSKSTYFYPKIPTGLVFHDLAGPEPEG